MKKKTQKKRRTFRKEMEPHPFGRKKLRKRKLAKSRKGKVPLRGGEGLTRERGL